MTSRSLCVSGHVVPTRFSKSVDREGLGRRRTLTQKFSFDISRFSTSNERVLSFFLSFFFERERELLLQVFIVMITKQIIPILFTEQCLTKAENVSGVITP